MTGWYFHNFTGALDAETQSLPTSVENIPRAEDPLIFHTTTMRKLVAPSKHWKAFNPSDNYRLRLAEIESKNEPVAVGHNRLLYEVVNHETLKPIYWDISMCAHVYHSDWVFQTSMTPIAKAWSVTLDKFVSKIKPWDQSYREKLEAAKTNPDIYDELHDEITFDDKGALIKLFLVCAPCNNESEVIAYLFSEYRQCEYIKILEDLVRDRTPSTVAATICRFNWEKWKSLQDLPDRDSDDEMYVPDPVTNLILVVHGIGQKLTDRIQNYNFTYAVDGLWMNMAKWISTPEVAEHLTPQTKFLVLPVNWRHLVDFSNSSYTLDDITMPKMSSIRGSVYDVVLDVPLYMSSHRPQILSAAANEANRIYWLVAKHHPTFAHSGIVNMVGHSLGSIIAADILSVQPTEWNNNGGFLDFNTNNLFTLGSPLGFFLFLRNRQLASRKSVEKHNLKHRGPASGLESLAVRSIYNIAHDLDLVAYRLNPTVLGDKDDLETAFIRPRDMSSQGIYGRAISSLKSWASARISHHVPQKLMLSEGFDEYTGFNALNDNGQVDWVIPSTKLSDQLLGLVTAHFSYWSNTDLARFLVLECGRYQDRAHSLPEYKATPKDALALHEDGASPSKDRKPSFGNTLVSRLGLKHNSI